MFSAAVIPHWVLWSVISFYSRASAEPKNAFVTILDQM